MRSVDTRVVCDTKAMFTKWLPEHKDESPSRIYVCTCCTYNICTYVLYICEQVYVCVCVCVCVCVVCVCVCDGVGVSGLLNSCIHSSQHKQTASAFYAQTPRPLAFCQQSVPVLPSLLSLHSLAVHSQ